MFPLLAAVIPSIVKAIGGAVRGKSKVVDAGLDVVQTIVGKPVNSLNDIDYSKLTPDQISALKEADYKFYTDYNNQIVQLAAQEISDRKDARQMQTQNHSRMPAIMTLSLTFGLFGIIIALFLYSTNLNAEESSLLHDIIVSYLTVWISANSFWFGTVMTNRGLKDKV